MSIEAREIAGAYQNNESIASALFALIDGNEDEWRSHADIKVTEEDDAILSVEYDGNWIDYYGTNVQDQGQRLLGEWPAEVVVGWGRPLEITLSGGGPSEWIEATMDSDGDVRSAVLRASYGSADMTWQLANTSALYRLAEYYAEINRMPESDD